MNANLRFLKEALVTEITGALRHKRHYFRARRMSDPALTEEFLEHAHRCFAGRIARRIAELGGDPGVDSESLVMWSDLESAQELSPAEMVAADFAAETSAIRSYSGMVRRIGKGDPATRRLMEEIVARKKRHAVRLAKIARGLCVARAAE
ncbi:MAG: ferritin-like domain-containing protein [Candidatus Omnitrophica bacterium]|nr:ferritin-like domain-containing protein [Candidatus Omnitrophota bacterium]